MDVTSDQLKSRYSHASDDELKNLYLSGKLTELAYECLVSEMLKRSILNYSIYKAANLLDLKDQKECLVSEILLLKNAKEGLCREIEKLKKEKKPSLLSLVFERRRLEEELKIKRLKSSVQENT
ncbi:hypothetical protein [Saccharophagus degradans]|uniref:Uncharacterized protein n=2 Tax=Saccharophagus degradans TaxID=86304 RepID=A0AAW7X2P3_9GAMM|nr:hypothetical protein [Saccharophagus degradans]MDO6420853.1 hypothetical protein [Saccharophagus degradans]